MKASVKPATIKKATTKVASKKLGHGSEKANSSSLRQTVTPKKKNTILEKVTYKAKRQSKLALKSMLLSPLFHTLCKVSTVVIVFVFVSYGLYAHFNSTLENDVVVSKSEIVDRVSKLTSLPGTPPDAVVRVQDPETLKKQNDFYANVKEGDYIIMYPRLAVIYDLRNNAIVSEKKTDK